VKHLLYCAAFALLGATLSLADDAKPAAKCPATGPATTQAAKADDQPAINKICPVDDKPVDRDVFIIYKGQKIGFCCEDCLKDFKEDPDRYMAKLKQQKQ